MVMRVGRSRTDEDMTLDGCRLHPRKDIVQLRAKSSFPNSAETETDTTDIVV